MHTPVPTGAATAPPRSRPDTLDPHRLLAAVADRRERLVELEDSFLAACEAAALGSDRGPDRSGHGSWDRGMWDRYLTCAIALEPRIGPMMRRLQDEISRLQRLADLPGMTDPARSDRAASRWSRRGQSASRPSRAEASITSIVDAST